VSIPTDYSPDDDPVLSDERLVDDADTRETYPRRPILRDSKRHAAREDEVRGMASVAAQLGDTSGMFSETAMTREEAMQTRTPPRPLQYSDLFKRGTPLSMSQAQPKEKYGARTQAALQASIEKTRFMGRAPMYPISTRSDKVSDYLLRPTSHGAAQGSGGGTGVERTNKEERLRMAADSPRYAHQDITDDEMWRDLMEESPAHTAGTRSSFDSLLSPRGGRAASRAQTDPVLDNVPENRLDRAYGRARLWPGSVDPSTPDLPPPPGQRRGRPRKQL
jgi:hypothetical protein